MKTLAENYSQRAAISEIRNETFLRQRYAGFEQPSTEERFAMAERFVGLGRVKDETMEALRDIYRQEGQSLPLDVTLQHEGVVDVQSDGQVVVQTADKRLSALMHIHPKFGPALLVKNIPGQDEPYPYLSYLGPNQSLTRTAYEIVHEYASRKASIDQMLYEDMATGAISQAFQYGRNSIDELPIRPNKKAFAQYMLLHNAPIDHMAAFHGAQFYTDYVNTGCVFIMVDEHILRRDGEVFEHGPKPIRNT